MSLNPAPYNHGEAIPPSDTANFPAGLCDAIQVGVGGIVVVVFQNSTKVSITAVAGDILPVKAKRVDSTTTTATTMVALYWK